LQLLGRDASGQQNANLVERQQAAAVLDQALEEAITLGNRRRHDDEQAPRGVAQAVRRSEHARVDREVGRARRSPAPARTIRRPPRPLFVGELAPARGPSLGHPPIMTYAGARLLAGSTPTPDCPVAHPRW